MTGPAGRLAGAWINSPLTPLLIAASVLLGVFSLINLPREEEPQILVPMVDVMVQLPGASPTEIEQRVTAPMEKLLKEIPGVEYVYSTSSPGMSLVIVRFLVGRNPETSVALLKQKLDANLDLIPPGASQPLVKPRSIDDVPILSLTFWSPRYGDYELRQVAAEVQTAVKQAPEVAAVSIIGGQKRAVEVTLQGDRLASYGMAPGQVANALSQANRRLPAGEFARGNQQFRLEAGDLLGTRQQVENTVAGVANGKAVYVRDVATVTEGGEEPVSLVRHSEGSGFYPAVTLAVSKRKGANAVQVSEEVLKRVQALNGTVIPGDVKLAVTRNYGETAKEKSNGLIEHMFIAVVSVSVLIALALGIREALIVFIAIPVTLGLTLTVFYLYGYTLNRITLFALIFSIGILVDDAIVVVENIVRHWRMPENRTRSPYDVAVEAVNEVGNPTILATLAVIAAILPMAFVGGLMGPYMRPIPIGASAAMAFSLLVAFLVTPWAAVRILKHGEGSHSHAEEDVVTRAYRRVMGALLHRPAARFAFLAGVTVLLLASCALVYVGWVKVKMLPFDNKNEFQIIVDMPNGTTLEETARVTQALAVEAQKQPGVINLQTYVGTASPYNFNGLVRHYYLRGGANSADIQVNLVGKDARSAKSHDIAREMRKRLEPLASRLGVRMKVAEVPPGPPVLQTLVAEIYGPDLNRRVEIARDVRQLFRNLNGVVDTDWYVEDAQPRYRLAVDSEKAALHSVSSEDVARTVQLASAGWQAGLLHAENAKEDVPITVRMDRAHRGDLNRVLGLRVGGVALSEMVQVNSGTVERSIYHKNLLPVTYVTADVAGEIESPAYAIFKLTPEISRLRLPEGYELEQTVLSLPESSQRYAMKWDGEWHVTFEVFRDMGIAFAFVLVLIYGLVVGWFRSFTTPLVIMAAIPFSLVGVLPAHGAMNAFFTATSMIGFIAGAGIVVRNSIILVDFIEQRLREGAPLDQAVIDAGAVRFRPMVLTAAAVVVGSSVILTDPIFQGLAIALMAGEIASLLLSRMTVPVLFFLLRRNSEEVV